LSAHVWPAPADRSVFVNCPFDEGYRESLDAMVFTIVNAGFIPWMAGSTGNVSVPRYERILEGLRRCRYSIHDLTRFQGEGAENVGRFNRPLELGMAMALRSLGSEEAVHDWLVLVPDGHIYHRFVSDLAGFDPGTHDGSPNRVALCVLAWLVTRPTADLLIGPDVVMPKLPVFSRLRRELDARWNDKTPWTEIVRLAVDVARS
jgi:hypothetical protein